MSAKAILPGAVILALLGGWTTRAAEPQPASPPAPARSPASELLPAPVGTPLAAPLVAGAVGSEAVPPGTVVDPWIAYIRPGCCGPFGADGPIGSEFFIRNGVSRPIEGGFLNNALSTGWMIDVGGRALFYNANTDAAWTASTSITQTYNNSGQGNMVLQVPFPFNVTEPDPTNPILSRTVFRLVDIPVTVRDYQRWAFSAAFGREWSLFNPAYKPGFHLRVGSDTGGRWGYGRLGLNDFTGLPNEIFYRRISDVFGTYFIAVYSDLEIPMCCNRYTFVSGIRGEWNYTWTNILPAQQRDLQDINLLWHIGVRF